MKAICISDCWIAAPGCKKAPKVPFYGEEVQITSFGVEEGINIYTLKGFFGTFDQAGFILISSLDETTFKRQYNLNK